jgi:dTDP-4-amino-4,6-dideoxygalactose transaminase
MGSAPSRRIPFNDLRRQHTAILEELRDAGNRVLESGWFVLGQELTNFEQAFAAWLGVPHGVGVASGTDAIHLALRAVGVQPGDEVIVPANTCVPTVAGIVASGATPVLADVEPDTLLLDPEDAARRITSKTRALVPVHLYGQPCAMPALMDLARAHGLRVVEDCAQAHGARLHGVPCGAWGDAAAFSFYPTKNLGALGDAGAVVTSDPTVAERVRRLRQYGETARYNSAVEGINSRLDELQAAYLRVKLQHLDAANAHRAALAARYTAGLAASRVRPLGLRPGADHAWHLYVVRHRDRDALAAHLDAAGIGTQVHYPRAIHEHPAYAHLGQGPGSFPVSQAASRKILSLPLDPGLSEDDVDYIVQHVTAFA